MKKTGAPRMLGDTWYASELGIEVFESGRRSLLRGLWLFLRGWRYHILVTTAGAPGARALAVLLAVAGARKLVLLEFLPGAKAGLRARVGRAVWRFALPRAARRIQVMTAWEAGRYAALFHVPEGRFVHVPWPLAARADEFPEVGSEIRRGVVASGRNSCDWETLFAAAAGQDWKLTAICGRADLGKVEGLARGTNTRVRCDIPAAEHFSEVAQAAVYAMPLHENMASAGHIRLMTAIAARTPVVASSIAGLDGYLVDTAVTVPSGDHLALRRAIGALLDDEVRRRRIVESAEAAAGRRTWADYIESVRELLRA